ncbi:MAG: hypothetical protein IPN84_18025 [Sphingomonadales bacterium]|nr:hypothetical protein [Sphingomonadales bacterium]
MSAMIPPQQQLIGVLNQNAGFLMMCSYEALLASPIARPFLGMASGYHHTRQVAGSTDPAPGSRAVTTC